MSSSEDSDDSSSSESDDMSSEMYPFAARPAARAGGSAAKPSGRPRAAPDDGDAYLSADDDMNEDTGDIFGDEPDSPQQKKRRAPARPAAGDSKRTAGQPPLASPPPTALGGAATPAGMAADKKAGTVRQRLQQKLKRLSVMRR